MLLAVLLLSPAGIIALFTFACFADRNFRDRFASRQKPFVTSETENTRRKRGAKYDRPEIS